MEGGDVVWLDERTVAIGRGYRTNDEGIRQFRELTKDFVERFIVVPMPHGEGEDACLHLMSVISMVDRDLAVVYSKFMPVFFRELLLERGIKLLEVDDEEYERLGSNVLALAPRVCLALGGNPRIKASCPPSPRAGSSGCRRTPSAPGRRRASSRSPAGEGWG